MSNASFEFTQLSDQAAANRFGTPLSTRTADSTPIEDLDARIIGDNPGQTLGELRQNALVAAGERWANFLMSDIPITVDFGCVDLGGESGGGVILAGASPTYLISAGQGLRNAPRNDVAYPIALANSFEGYDIAPSEADIEILINTHPDLESGNLVWYYGLNEEAPFGTVSLFDTIMHELGHGLGFSSFVDLASGAHVLNVSDIFSAMIYDISSDKTWIEMTNTERRLSATNTGNVVWNGVHSNGAASGVNNYLQAGTSQENSYVAGSAMYGPALDNTGLTGEIVLALDGVADEGTTSDAAQDLTNPDELAGKIALIDRGVNHFELKTLRAQNAGAIAVVIVNNVAGQGVFNLSGSSLAEQETTIPTILVSYETGVTLKNTITTSSPLSVSLFSNSLLINEESDSSLAKIQLYAPGSLEIGSSISHWSTSTYPNLLMEPNSTGGYSNDLDLSPLLMKDIGWQTSNIKIPHLKYSSWLSENNLSTSSLNAEPTGDYDQDGISNLLEYVSSGSPSNPSNTSSQNLTIESGSTLSYHRSSLLNDIEITYETSYGILSNWVTYTPTETISDLGEGIESVTTPLSDADGNKFFRLNYTFAE